MTDLERARDAIQRWASDEHRELRLIGKSQAYLPALVERLAAALDAARRDSAEEMRERIAVELAATSPYYARLVRALSLTPEEPT